MQDDLIQIIQSDVIRQSSPLTLPQDNLLRNFTAVNEVNFRFRLLFVRLWNLTHMLVDVCCLIVKDRVDKTKMQSSNLMHIAKLFKLQLVSERNFWYCCVAYSNLSLWGRKLKNNGESYQGLAIQHISFVIHLNLVTTEIWRRSVRSQFKA